LSCRAVPVGKITRAHHSFPVRFYLSLGQAPKKAAPTMLSPIGNRSCRVFWEAQLEPCSREGPMKRLRFIGTGILAIGTLAGAAWAAEPSKGDKDFCNQKAAQVSKATPVKPGAGTTRQPAPPPPASGPSDSSKPGTPVSPGTAAQPAPGTGNPQSGSNPTGGRMTDSSQPGTPPSALGMAPIGETDQAYRQAYLACITQRTK
jgi:hypothetical protein